MKGGEDEKEGRREERGEERREGRMRRKKGEEKGRERKKEKGKAGAVLPEEETRVWRACFRPSWSGECPQHGQCGRQHSGGR